MVFQKGNIYGKLRKGFKDSEETKQKKRIARMGKKNPMFGKKHSEKTKLKMSKIKKSRYNGCDNPKWKGGKNGYFQMIARRIVKKITGIDVKYPIVTHHIDGNVRNNNPNNLLVCSAGYHSGLHIKLIKKYGKNWRSVFK